MNVSSISRGQPPIIRSEFPSDLTRKITVVALAAIASVVILALVPAPESLALASVIMILACGIISNDNGTYPMTAYIERDPDPVIIIKERRPFLLFPWKDHSPRFPVRENGPAPVPHMVRRDAPIISPPDRRVREPVGYTNPDPEFWTSDPLPKRERVPQSGNERVPVGQRH